MRGGRVLISSDGEKGSFYNSLAVVLMMIFLAFAGMECVHADDDNDEGEKGSKKEVVGSTTDKAENAEEDKQDKGEVAARGDGSESKNIEVSDKNRTETVEVPGPRESYSDVPPGAELISPLETKRIIEAFYTGDISEDIQTMAKLKDHPLQEVAVEYALRIRYEMQATEGNMDRARFMFIDMVLSGLARLIHQHDPGLLDQEEVIRRSDYNLEVEQSHEEIARHLDYLAADLREKYGLDSLESQALFEKIIEIRELYLRAETPLPYLEDFLRADPAVRKSQFEIESSIPPLKSVNDDKQERNIKAIEISRYRDMTLEKAREKVSETMAHLNANVIEQPEVLRFLEEVEMRNFLYPRQEPVVFMTMGLAGGGKDTIAEGYAIAMHNGDVNAAEEHMYRLKIARHQTDLWADFGSNQGLVGSTQFPPFLDWCVDHSGGKYLKVPAGMGPDGSIEYRIELNSEWKGKNLPGFIPPEKAIVFINEFHDWAYDVKNDVVKQMIEKGIIPINNPNGGVAHMRLFFTFQIASNDGITLLADRHIDGRPRGKRQPFKELMKRWKAVHHRKDILRAELTKSPSGSSSGGLEGSRKGTSEELANRIQNIFLLQPISPEGLRKITEIFMERIRLKMENINKRVGKVVLNWTQNLVDMIQKYQYVAEDNARPLKNKVEQIVQATLDRSIFEGDFGEDSEVKRLDVDVREKSDGTYELVVKYGPDAKGELTNERVLPIGATEATRYNDPLSQEDLAELMRLGDRLKSQIFGLDHVIDEIVKAIVRSESEATVNLERVDAKLPAANVFAFFGLSSTGKTEMTKALSEVLTGDRENFWLVNANKLKSERAWDDFFGYDQNNPDDKSEFQREYDRRNGRMIVVLDELANANPEHVKILYDYFREAEVGGRKMAGVTFIVTGNAGEEWYQGIPSRVPETEKHFSMLEIYRKMVRRKNEQEDLLKQYFPEALIKRIGMRRVFFFPPLNFKAIRQLFYLKLGIYMKAEFAENREKYWWDVKFSSREQIERVVEVMEREGFQLDGQGASIDQYVKDGMLLELKYKLKQLLAKNKIKVGDEVILSFNEGETRRHANDRGDDAGVTKKGLYLDVSVPRRGESFTFFVQGHPHQLVQRMPKQDQVLTAYHEAGHELVRHIFLGDKFMPDGISVIPGVDWFGTRWIYYLGVARSEQTEYLERTREATVREMAVSQGGWMAQVLVTKGEYHDAGKSNDIHYATELAREAILVHGVSDKFGVEAIPDGMTPAEYARGLKGERAEIFRSELQGMLDESVQLAKEALLVNFDVLVKMGQELARVGDMKGEAMRAFYEKHGSEILAEFKKFEEYRDIALEVRRGEYTRNERGDINLFSEMNWLTRLRYKLGNLIPDHVLSEKSLKDKETEYRARNGEFRTSSLMPDHVEMISDVVNRYKEKNRAGVSVPDTIPVRAPADVINLRSGELDLAVGVDLHVQETPAASRSCRVLFL